MESEVDEAQALCFVRAGHVMALGVLTGAATLRMRVVRYVMVVLLMFILRGFSFAVLWLLSTIMLLLLMSFYLRYHALQ